ncbi:cytidine and deoxycytidylate deaminase zinc-binding region domain-containing protein [Podospora aff. communis PSN243]|uniref:Cytidine and deoxycytidylate deaminase zinc-binding region domain-containing protein n=1 Tax=Podospora aff. communis PSN243 TaxID=3040156 RepID=A0AAV9GQK7_9PEZI|nr:cytidine and deoxycytidylate deaminase zinc-binding region domain-containing protein [Podospora aff. communis PSN243]
MSSCDSLLARATEAISRVPVDDENHTVAAAALSRSGEVFVGLNVYHFTGGPCAELVALGVAAANGVLAKDILVMGAVVRRAGNESGKVIIDVINPCGRCRQVLLDYNPEMEVIVRDDGGGGTVVTAESLLPHAYIWPDGNTGDRS